MKNLILIIFCLNALISSSQNPNGWDTAWVSSFGGKEIDIGKDIKETSDKGFIIAGNTSSFGSGNTSFYIIKTDSMGLHQWSKSIGSEYNDFCNSVEIANDGGFFFSGYSNQIFQNGYDGYVIKTDSLGNLQWSKNYGGNDWDFIYNSCIMPDGGLLLCGETSSGSQGGSDAYLIRTDLNGDTIWTRRLGAQGNDAFYSVEQKNNRIYAVGRKHDSVSNLNVACIYKLNHDGDVLSSDFYSENNSDDMSYFDLHITSTSEILLCGKRGSSILGHPILRKIDTTNLAEIGNLPNNQNFHLKSITEGTNNEIYVLGLSTGGLGGYAANYIRYNGSLSHLRNGTFGGVKDEEGSEIIKTSRGFAFIGSTNTYGNAPENTNNNVYLVIFNKHALEDDYYINLTEFQDNLSPVSLTENKTKNTKTNLYPNPVNSTFRIDFSDNTLENKVLKYELFDAQGKKVGEEELIVTDNYITLNRNNIPSGIYLCILTFNSSIILSEKISLE